MRIRKYMAIALLGLFLMPSTGDAASKKVKKTALIVLPNSYVTVQLAFDIAKKRSVTLVSYQKPPELKQPVLHLWVRSERKWAELSMEDYSTGAFVATKPSSVFVIGEKTELVTMMAEGASWSGDVRKMQTIKTAQLLNSFAKSLNFSGKELKWFANRYGLSYENANKWYTDKYDPKVKKRMRVMQNEATEGEVEPEKVETTEIVVEEAKPENK